MLGWLRAAFALVLLVLSVFAGAVFATQNAAAVPLSLLVISLPEQPLAVWLLLFLMTGVIIGSLLGSAVLLRLRAGLSSLRRENRRLQQRLERSGSNG